MSSSCDIVAATIKSGIVLQHVPNAQLIVYPNSGHAAHYKYPELFLKRSKLFLDFWLYVNDLGSIQARYC
ncbi:alpha/beta fold hydrolase [Paraburkholderia sp. GAS32]|uniref:alpha/beta fold hydrolase n=1 Tax=Paraburkholderia sp. GAS32 TaxID=3035129 RepID=UPI003D1E3242